MSKKVVIVGAGAAGCFTAYRLWEMYKGDQAYDITLLERHDRVGGNAYSTTVQYGGQSYNIDCGAQFFYRNPQVSYVELLTDLGLFNSDTITSAATGFNIYDSQTKSFRLRVPGFYGELLTLSAKEWADLVLFGVFLIHAVVLDAGDDWEKSVDEWLANDVDLVPQSFKDEVIRPFFYQFVTLPYDQIGGASAKYAVTYFVRNVFGEPGEDPPDPDTPSTDSKWFPIIKTYQSKIGLDGVMKKALERAGVVPVLGANVTGVTFKPQGLTVHSAKGDYDADHLVLACHAPYAGQILQGSGAAPDLVETLVNMPYAGIGISMQKDGSCYMPEDESKWQAVNTIVDGQTLMFSAWFGPLRKKYDGGKRIPVFKSWGTPELSPKDCEHRFLPHGHYVVLPTVDFMKRRAKVKAAQGYDHRVWFAGGWTNWFDSQEAALDSATMVAEALPGAIQPNTGRSRMVSVAHEKHAHNVRRWAERVAKAAPGDSGKPIEEALKKLDPSR